MFMKYEGYSSFDKAREALKNVKYEKLRCIDVSEFQGDINWTAIKNSGIEAAIIRVGVRGWGDAGNRLDDNRYIENLRNAKAAGIKVGVYYYSMALNEKEALEEAKQTCENIKKAGVKLELPVTIDIEITDGNSSRAVRHNSVANKKQNTDVVIKFCEYVRSQGYEPMIYSSAYFFKDNLDYSRLGSYKIWVAHWGAKFPNCPLPYTCWQYSATGKVNGIDRRWDVDMDTYCLRK